MKPVPREHVRGNGIDMANRYTFIDVETPNTRNDRICQIGIVQTDSLGHEIFRNGYLVNPECLFSRANIQIHGITDSDCRDQPVFPDLWEKIISDLFEDSILVAHNAFFDFNVLAKTFDGYGLPMPSLRVCDTMELCGCGLADACQSLGISLGKHHDALSDAVACKEIFWTLSPNRTINPKPFVPSQPVNPSSLTKEEREAICRLSVELQGFLEGIELDASIDEREIDELKDISHELRLTHIPILIAMHDVILEALADGKLSEDEWAYLMQVCHEINDSTSYCDKTVAHQELIGILKGINADGILSESEISSLSVWLDWHDELEGAESLRGEIEEILSDGIITEKEQSLLRKTLDDLIDPIVDSAKTGTSDVVLEGKSFCLSGDFDYGKKADVASYIIEHGGTISKNVTKKCDYVVVGGGGSCNYAFGNYGTKVKKALVYKEKGCNIEVIGEHCLFD